MGLSGRRCGSWLVVQTDRVAHSRTRLRRGFGWAGVIAALVIGTPILLPPIINRPTSSAWAAVLLVGAAFIYIALAALRERRRLPLTGIQLAVACVLALAAAATGLSLLIAASLLGHAVWDSWHLVRDEQYVPAWYAGACVYVDVIAAGIVLALH